MQHEQISFSYVQVMLCTKCSVVTIAYQHLFPADRGIWCVGQSSSAFTVISKYTKI